VGEVVTHLRAIVQRLKNMRRRDASGNEIDVVPSTPPSVLLMSFSQVEARSLMVYYYGVCQDFNRRPIGVV
jgi:hypothetical protein